MNASSTQDRKSFANPSGNWEHHGTFSVELTPAANKSIAPSGTQFNGDIVTVPNGRIKQAIGGIQLYTENGSPFFWGYGFVKAILKSDGTLLWVNRNHR